MSSDLKDEAEERRWSECSVWEENSIGAGCWAWNIEKRYLSPGTLHSASSFHPEKASSGQVVGSITTSSRKNGVWEELRE